MTATKQLCTISGRDRFERGKRLHGSAGASHSRDRENPFRLNRFGVALNPLFLSTGECAIGIDSFGARQFLFIVKNSPESRLRPTRGDGTGYSRYACALEHSRCLGSGSVSGDFALITGFDVEIVRLKPDLRQSQDFMGEMSG